MRTTARMVACMGIVGTVFGVVACSGSTSQSGGHGSSSGGGQSSGGQSSSGSAGGSGGSSSGGGVGDDGGSVTGDDASSSSSSGGSTLNLNGWTCPSDSVLGGYSTACVSCLEAMCLTQLQACQTGTCATCEGPVFTCESQMCQSACGAGASSSGAGSSGVGDGGGTATGSCAGLMTCCGLAASIPQLASFSAQCTSVAQSGNQTSCQSLIAMLPSTLSTYCQ